MGVAGVPNGRWMKQARRPAAFSALAATALLMLPATGAPADPPQLDAKFNGKLDVLHERHDHDQLQGEAPGHAPDRSYTFVITDKSPSNGLTLARGGTKPTRLTAAGFVGRHTWKLNLTTGRWLFATTRAKATQAILVG